MKNIHPPAAMSWRLTCSCQSAVYASDTGTWRSLPAGAAALAEDLKTLGLRVQVAGLEFHQLVGAQPEAEERLPHELP